MATPETGGYDHDGNLEAIDFKTLDLLIVGVGGLGTEILRCASLRQFNSIHIIDMDRVEVPNLGVQYLYRYLRHE